MSSAVLKQFKDASLRQIQDKYGKRCSFINLESEKLRLSPKYMGLVRQIRDLQTLRNDLRYVAKWIDILMEFQISSEHDGLIANSLWFSVIITYAKCFSPSEKKTNLEEKDYFKGENEELISIHKHMIDIRHSYIAHNLNHNYSTTEIFLVLSDHSQKELFGVDGISYSLRSPKQEDLKAYKSVVIMVHNKVDNRVLEKQNYLYTELKSLKAIDEWYKFITDEDI